jgi:hypothetical protein
VIPTDLNNRLLDIDIMGSWMEIGMAFLALLAGCVMVYPIARTILRQRLYNNNKWNPTCTDFREHQQKIQDSLAEIRLRLDCGRTCLLQFHNGGTYLDGSGIKKFSLTHESSDVGVSETSKDRQDMLMTQYLDLLGELSENDPYPRLVFEMPDSIFKRHLESAGTEIFSAYPVKNLKTGTTVGLILSEWIDHVKIESLGDEDICYTIEECVRKIEPHMRGGKK